MRIHWFTGLPLASIVKEYRPPVLVRFEMMGVPFYINGNKKYSNNLEYFSLLSSHFVDYFTVGLTLKGGYFG